MNDEKKKAIEDSTERPNSVKISINAKGLWSGECKVYADDIEEAMTKSLSKAEELAALIKSKNEEI